MINVRTWMQHMTLVWSLSPFLALVFSPILGSISDRCRLSYGRRRPMILTFTVLIITGTTAIHTYALQFDLVIKTSFIDY